jgi:hypothetical protein
MDAGDVREVPGEGEVGEGAAGGAVPLEVEAAEGEAGGAGAGAEELGLLPRLARAEAVEVEEGERRGGALWNGGRRIEADGEVGDLAALAVGDGEALERRGQRVGRDVQILALAARPRGAGSLYAVAARPPAPYTGRALSFGVPREISKEPRPMRPSAILLPLLGLLTLAAAAPLRGDEDGRVAAGRQLARAERALAATGQAARAPRAGLPRGGPFWAALDRMSRSLAQADAGLRAGDARYFAALSEGSRALAELEVVWGRTGPRDPAVEARVAALSAAYRRLRNGYGWEALRRGQGGALTAAEARRFRALQQADAQVAARLKPVQAKVIRAGDPAMAEQLRRLREQAQRVATAERTLEAYLTAELLNDIVQGEWAASQHYVRKPYRATWRKAAPAIEKLATDPGIGFVFAADLSKVESWSFDGGAEEAAAPERGAPAPAAESAAPAPPARDETPVDEVEIVDGKSQRTEGVAAEPGATAEPGAAPEATPSAAEASPPADAPPAATEAGAAPGAEASPAPVAPGPAGTTPEGAAVEPAPPVPPSAAPPASAPPEGAAADPGAPGDGAPPLATETGSGDPGADPGMAAPQDPEATPAPPEAAPAPEAQPPGDAPGATDPQAAPPPTDPNAPDAGQPAPPPPGEAEPPPVEPPPPPPLPPPV